MNLFRWLRLPCSAPPVDSESKPSSPNVEVPSVWIEGPEILHPRPVSRDFIDGLRAAGARDSLIDALEKQRADWEKSF